MTSIQSTNTSIISVAERILRDYGPMSTMKLQKLCYFAQGWSLAWVNKPLFREDFQAWVNGPVCYDLFKIHKGMYQISESAFKSKVPNPAELNEIEEMILDAAVDPYRCMTGLELSELTHDGGPWEDARTGLNHTESSSKVISKESIRKWFADEEERACSL